MNRYIDYANEMIRLREENHLMKEMLNRSVSIIKKLSKPKDETTLITSCGVLRYTFKPHDNQMKININSIGESWEAEIISGGVRSITKEESLEKLFESVLSVASAQSKLEQATQLVISKGEHLTPKDLQEIIKSYSL